MIRVRPSEERGYEDKGWLKTYHTFSFDTYYNADHMGFSSLRVMNEDTVEGEKGFTTHMHKEMEIVTYVIEGTLEHKDSVGNTGIIQAGEAQCMSAGTGITHSEYNLSPHFPVHFLQMWFYPNQHGLTPSYSQRIFSSAAKWGQWCLLVSGNGRNGSLRIHQDADIYTTLLEEKEEIDFETLIDRSYWVQIISGKFHLLNTILKAGDGASITDETIITVKCLEGGELLLFDLA